MILHVANGHSATRLIESSGVPGRTTIWADPLNDGPVPANIADEELLRIRAAFLAATPEQVEEVAADLAQWRAAIDDQDSYEELVLWFEHDLFDQLNLIQLLSRLGVHSLSKPATIVQIDSYPGHPHFKGIGELTPADVQTLFHMRQPITPDQMALAVSAWSAYRSPDPRAIEQLLQGDTSALPFLASALSRHLEEFPSDGDGLSRSERRLMQVAVDGPVEIHEAWRRMHDGETAYYITDLSFFDAANALASSPPPLLTINLANPSGSVMPVGTLELTGHGRSVLLGQADRVQLCGSDRWLGGVHLQGRGPVWRWSRHAGRLIQA